MANIPPSELLEMADAEALLAEALQITNEEAQPAIEQFMKDCEENGVVRNKPCQAGECLKPELFCDAFRSTDGVSPIDFICKKRLPQIKRYHLCEWAGISQTSTTKRQKDIGGRPAKYQWADFDKEMLKVANHPDGFDSVGGKQGLVKHMEKWCADNWAEQPAGSQIRDHVGKRYPD